MLESTAALSDEELALFNELFSSRFGLYFPEHKKGILESRLWPRLRANRLRRFLDYYLLLQYDFQRELDPLTQALTNNESYFFRETSQFEALLDSVSSLRESSGQNELRFLSAGCSAGEEPYTLNLFLRGYGGVAGATGQWQIDAIDLDSQRLRQARHATYRRSSLRTLEESQIDRFFHRHGPESFELRANHRNRIEFASANILDLQPFARSGAYDTVFCRNVLIYFSEAALKKVIDHFARLVRPGGLLFLGHSESIIGLSEAFQAERLGQCIAYRRTRS